MSTNAEAEASQTESVQGHVRTFPEIKALVDTFYGALPGEMIGTVQKRTTLTEEEKDAFKGRVNLAQELFEEFEATRLATRSNFTAEELRGLGYKKLQMIAKSFRLNAKMSENGLVVELTGKPKSIPVTQTKYWKDKDNRSVLIARLREARTAYKTVTGEDITHPRQQVAMDRAAIIPTSC
jgi:hypothetical protein